MGDTVASNPSLQVSVSFGRFENESLSWEKWSSFSPNKYLEEVEKCATPGSVAQKKAYFEAHYKKIAARKAELLDQEKQAENNLSKSDHIQNNEDPSVNTSGSDAEFDVSNSQGSSTKEIRQATYSTTEIGGMHVDSVEVNIAESRDYQNTSVEEENKELESRSDDSHQGKPEEAIYTKEESIPIEDENMKEPSRNFENGIRKGKASQVEAEDVKLDHPEGSKKSGQVNYVNKESIAAKTKRKPAVPTSKAHHISTPKSSRPTPTLTKTLASASSSKKGNSPSSSGKKNTSTGENKRVANKSLHMSLSLGPSNLDPVPLATTRKSLIMEKMGDKDIVKRAFKTFQNNFNEARSPITKQVPSRGTQPKVPTSMALRKENGRPTNVDSTDKISGNAVRSTTGLKSDVRAVKGKEPSKKLEEKSNAKGAERTRLQSKPKEGKEAETKRLKHNVKATTLPAFSRGPKVSKSRPEKGDVKPDNPR